MKNVAMYFREKRIFFRFTLTYMTFFAVTLLVTCLLYTTTLGVLEEYAVDSALSLLEQSREAMDSHIQELNSVVDRMAEDYNIQSFLSVSKPLQDSDYDSLRNLFVKLPYTYTNNTLVKYLFVYFPNSDIIISPTVASGRIQSMYDHYFNYEGMSYEEWKASVLSGRKYSVYWPPQNITTEGKSLSAITYIQNILSLYYTDTGGYVMALMDENDLEGILDNNLIQNGGLSYILDENGNRIISVDHTGLGAFNIPDNMFGGTGYFQIPTDIGEMLVMYTSSEVNNWKYISVIPVNTLMNKVNNITTTFIIIAVSAFILALFVAVFMANKNSRPIQEMVRALGAFIGKEGARVDNEYDFINGTITNLICMNTNLREDMHKQETLIKNVFFERLLRNRFANSDEMKNHMEYARIRFRGEAYFVVLARISGYYGQVTRELLGDLGEVRVLVMNILQSHFNGLGYLHQVDEYHIAIVMGANGDFDVKRAICLILEELEKYNIVISFGFGRARTALSEVWESFNEAEKALELTEGTDNAICVFDGAQKGGGEYYYPLQLEARLSSLVKVGEKQGVKEVLDAIRRENYKNRRLTTEKLSLLMGELFGTINKLMDELFPAEGQLRKRIDEALKPLMNRRPSEASFVEASAILAMMSEQVLKRKESNNGRLRDEMLAYVQKDYMNHELCLYSAAARFNLAEKYFSRFFKEQTGENFSSHLEQVRMEKAKELLSQSRYTIADIAQRVGYININTFYKAFKRVHGVSPRFFRQRE